MIAKVTPKEAAALMGCSPQFIRIGLQQGRLDIGDAVKMSTMWTYNISPAKIAERQGLTVDQIEKKLQEMRKGA